jgi:hypothetical protein
LIEDQVATAIRFVFELFDEVTIRPSEQFPIEPTQVVTFGIWPILTELGGKAMKGTAVKAVIKSLDNRFGA